MVGWSDLRLGGRVCYAIKKAGAGSERDLLAIIRAAKAGWVGAEWILERTKPDRYARRDRIDLTVARKEIAALSDLDLRVLARLAALSQGTTLELIEAENGFSVPSEKSQSLYGEEAD